MSSTGGALHGTWVSDGSITSSDRRLKTSILPLYRALASAKITNATEAIRRMRPVSFKFTANEAKANPRFGFIAQEVQEIFPSMIQEHDNFLRMTYQDLIAVLVLGLQEAAVSREDSAMQLEKLQARIDLLNGPHTDDTLRHGRTVDTLEVQDSIAALQDSIAVLASRMAALEEGKASKVESLSRIAALEEGKASMDAVESLSATIPEISKKYDEISKKYDAAAATSKKIEALSETVEKLRLHIQDLRPLPDSATDNDEVERMSANKIERKRIADEVERMSADEVERMSAEKSWTSSLLPELLRHFAPRMPIM